MRDVLTGIIKCGSYWNLQERAYCAACKILLTSVNFIFTPLPPASWNPPADFDPQTNLAQRNPRDYAPSRRLGIGIARNEFSETSATERGAYCVEGALRPCHPAFVERTRPPHETKPKPPRSPSPESCQDFRTVTRDWETVAYCASKRNV